MTQDREFQALYEALLSAFPTEARLARMLRFRMGLNLAEIASGNLSSQVFDVVRFAEARGLLDQLLQSALAASPGSKELAALAGSRTRATEAPGPLPAGIDHGAAPVTKAALREAIQKSYTLEELDLLCADLQEHLQTGGQDGRLSLDDIAGATKPAKVLNLIEFFDRRRLLDVLIEKVRRQRPGIL